MPSQATHPAPHVRESDFQAAVVELARLRGWRVAHFRPARTAHGWATPVAYDGKGFPDLVLCRDTRMIFAELKQDNARLHQDQHDWLEALGAVAAEANGIIEAACWRPRDWPEIEATLA